jgi:hypothetical protein
MDLALHMGLMWMKGHTGYGTQPSTPPITIFLVNQAPTPHLKLFLVTRDLLWLPLVTYSFMEHFLFGLELAVLLLLTNLLHKIFRPEIYDVEIYEGFFKRKKWPKFVKF